MYGDLSNISIAIGENDIIVNDIEWNPNTDDFNLLLLGGVLLIVSGIAFVAYKKFRLN